MNPADDVLFNHDVWRPAIEKFAAATRLTVSVHAAGGRLACGPVFPTPLFDLLAAHGYAPGIFEACVRRCLAQTGARPAVALVPAFGLAVVGTSLALDGRIVGAAVAGYALADFSQRSEIEQLAHVAGIPFAGLWAVTRLLQPIPERRLLLHGELLQVLGDTVLREIHRTHQYEEAATELKAASASKDEFLAVLSHELRTPLTPILGWARMLKQGDTTKVAHAAQVIERNALLQIRLVDDLLELTRLSRSKVTLDLRPCDVGEAIRAAQEAFAEQAQQKGILLSTFAAEPRLMVNADANRLQQIFRNVFSNAVKFTPSGGRITAALVTEGDTAVVSIRDTGEGIVAEFLPFVFDMFQQQERGTRRTHEGLGIGLALVKRLTELHGGRVAIASAGLARGTAVTIRFPVVAGVNAPVAAPPAVLDHVPALNGLRVLVVEDVDDTRETTRLMLERLGADVTVASDGVEALELIDHAAPDVVLCDLRMPRMDGFEFMQALQVGAGHPQPPVVAVSGFASSADHQRTERAGFEGHLDKPFDETALLAVVRPLMPQRQMGD